MQWSAFVRTLGKLLAQDNDVIVVVGPFNEHMIAAENKPAFEALRNGITAFLGYPVIDYKERRAKFIAPKVLPSELYADGSHPLTQGYEELARRILPELTKFWPDLK